MHSLKRFNEFNCSVTPHLIRTDMTLQGEGYPMPYGYMVFLLIEKVPGEPLTDFWKYGLKKRNKIRVAFAKGLGFVSAPVQSGFR